MTNRRLTLWPRSLKGQMLLSLALALLLAQTLGAVFQYQIQLERRRDLQVHMLAFRTFTAWRRAGEPLPGRLRDELPLPPGNPPAVPVPIDPGPRAPRACQPARCCWGVVGLRQCVRQPGAGVRRLA